MMAEGKKEIFFESLKNIMYIFVIPDSIKRVSYAKTESHKIA